MMKRVTWFVGGVATGAAGMSYAKRKVKRAAAQLAPAHVARQASESLKAKGQDLAEAVREGREAMRAKEAELRARRDGHAVVGGADVLAADVLPVVQEGGQVVVLQQVRDESRSRGIPATRPRRRSAR